MSGEAPESREGQAPSSPPAAVQPPSSGTSDDAPHASGHMHAHHSPIQFRFFEQLKHRNVIRLGILYLVVCWLILDPVHVLFHMLEVPVWANRLVVILMVIGFPAVLLFGWVYEITPEGLKPTAEVDPHRSIRRQTGQRLNRAIGVVLVLAVAYLLTDKFWLSKHTQTQQAAAPVASGSAAATPAGTTISPKSIAVLSFADMSEKHDQEYFADGMAEEILDQLVKVRQLKVISRTSSFQYKGKNTDVRTIGAAIGARYLVEGSVRKSGSQLRITAQLIDASDGLQRWSDRYDRDIGDILKVQDEIATSLVRALEVSVGAFELPARTVLRVPAAYEAYLRARHAEDRFNQQGFEEALEDYREALRLDPQFARAAAALGLLQNLLAIWGYLPVDTAFSQARASAELAIRLDSSLAMPHSALALTHVFHDWDWSAAKRELERATALEPLDPTTEWAAAQLGMALGEWDEATRHINASLALDPLNAISHYILSTIRLGAGHADEAEAAIRRTLQISPSYAWAHYRLADILIVRGKPEDALTVVQQEPEDEARLWGLASVNFALGRKAASDEALELLTKIGASDWAYGIAGVHASRGEVDEAFRWLERAYAQKDVDLCEIKAEPAFAKIVRDPRYKAFLRKMNLPE